MDARGDRDHPNGADLGRDLKVLDGIASWCGAVHGSMPLSEALGTIAQSLDSVAAAVTRDARGEGRGRLVAEFDARAADRDATLIQRGFAEDILGEFYNRLQAGAVWFLSDRIDEDDTPQSSGLANWRLARGIVDIAVVALETAGVQNDYLEFHFTETLSNSAKSEIETLMPTLVRAWSGRKTGLVTRAQMDERMVRARAAAAAGKIQPMEPILGVSNPARLSRAEFRVCLLLSRGLSVKAVTDELGLSESTIRSHLRSIYSKTETSGLAELLYRILAATGEGYIRRDASLA